MEKITINQKILSKNDLNAMHLRNKFTTNKTLVINMMSSPGSGKTSFLEKVLVRLKDKYNIAVIEGDLQTENDKQRIEAIGVRAIQIQTGGACHLEAHEIDKKCQELGYENLDLLIIENVGNLVCPAEYDLGQDINMVMLSVTEGDDKPLKYPTIFFNSDIFILNKIDLLPYVDFSVKKALENARTIKNNLDIFQISCRNDEGLDNLQAFIETKILAKKRCS